MSNAACNTATGQIQPSLSSLTGLATAFRQWKDWLCEAWCEPRRLQSLCQPVEDVMGRVAAAQHSLPGTAWLAECPPVLTGLVLMIAAPLGPQGAAVRAELGLPGHPRQAA